MVTLNFASSYALETLRTISIGYKRRGSGGGWDGGGGSGEVWYYYCTLGGREDCQELELGNW